MSCLICGGQTSNPDYYFCDRCFRKFNGEVPYYNFEEDGIFNNTSVIKQLEKKSPNKYIDYWEFLPLSKKKKLSHIIKCKIANAEEEYLKALEKISDEFILSVDSFLLDYQNFNSNLENVGLFKGSQRKAYEYLIKIYKNSLKDVLKELFYERRQKILELEQEIEKNIGFPPRVIEYLFLEEHKVDLIESYKPTDVKHKKGDIDE